MISGFCEIVKSDVQFVIDALSRNSSNVRQAQRQEQEEKAHLVGLRIIGAVGMGLCAFVGIRAFIAQTATGALLQLATATVAYAFFHDLFVIGVNKDKGLLNQLGSIGTSLWKYGEDVYNGKKKLGKDLLYHPQAEGTFYRPIWDKLLWAIDIEWAEEGIQRLTQPKNYRK